MRCPLWLRRLVVLGLARRVLAGLPDPLLPVVAQVDLQVKTVPDAEDLARGASPELRGYYCAEQDELEDAGCEDHLPAASGSRPQIVLFAGNLEPTAEAVATVLVHELGHHLGFSECELVEGLGLI